VDATLKGLRRKPDDLRRRRNSFRVAKNQLAAFLTQGFKANPGLKLANAFGVHFTSDFKVNQI
jgi:hypothetical protein